MNFGRTERSTWQFCFRRKSTKFNRVLKLFQQGINFSNTHKPSNPLYGLIVTRTTLPVELLNVLHVVNISASSDDIAWCRIDAQIASWLTEKRSCREESCCPVYAVVAPNCAAIIVLNKTLPQDWMIGPRPLSHVVRFILASHFTYS